jgi:hypothetical protein
MAVNFFLLSVSFILVGFFDIQTNGMGPTVYFPSEGSRATDFFALKNLLSSAGFDPLNLGSNGKHATFRPPTATFLHLERLL